MLNADYVHVCYRNRLSTIQAADRIVVMTNGQIAEVCFFPIILDFPELLYGTLLGFWCAHVLEDVIHCTDDLVWP